MVPHICLTLADVGSRNLLPLVLATTVQALFRNNQSLDRLVADNVRFDDFVDVADGHAAVPNPFWINDDCWTMFALIKAPGFVCAHKGFDVPLRQLQFEDAMQFTVAARIA